MSEVESAIEQTKGRFFSITFIKKDGSFRTINAKDRYESHIKGTGSPATDALKAQGYKFLFDRNQKRFFSYKPEKVVRIKCGGIDRHFPICKGMEATFPHVENWKQYAPITQ
jgi:hypothetical protein